MQRRPAGGGGEKLLHPSARSCRTPLALLTLQPPSPPPKRLGRQLKINLLESRLVVLSADALCSGALCQLAMAAAPAAGAWVVESTEQSALQQPRW